MYGYIYKTTNTVNGKFYIGKCVSESFRGTQYLGSGKLLRAAVKKYGKDKFIVELVEECSNNEDLCQQEIFWIKKLNAQDLNIAYNLADGGQGGSARRGVPMSEETKLKMHLTAVNRSPERKAEISEICRQAQLGRKQSDETREKRRQSMLGKNSRPHTEEEKKQLSLARRGKLLGEENPAKRPEVRKKISLSKMNHSVSEETRLKISESNRTRGVSDETRMKQRLARIGKPANNTGKIAINRDGVIQYILADDFQVYSADGWKRGRK